MFFASFYLVLLSAFGADALFRSVKALAGCRARATRSALRASIIACLMALQAGNFLALYAVLPEHSLGRHPDAVPLRAEHALFGQGRVLSIGYGIETDGSDSMHVTARLLGYNYATLFDLDHFAGYDVVLPQRNADATFGFNYTSVVGFRPGLTVPVDYLRHWGVKWYLLDGRIPLDSVPGLVRVDADRTRIVLEDPQALPLVS